MTMNDFEASQCIVLTENWPYLGNGEKYGLGYY